MAFNPFDYIKKKLDRRKAIKQPPVKKTKPKKSPKEIATAAGEPYVSVLKVDVDPANPRYGSFELDWNEHFVKRLMEVGGYRGDNDEAIVDQWFQDVCRHVVLETYEQEQANIARSDNIVRYINRNDLGGGKTEVS